MSKGIIWSISQSSIFKILFPQYLHTYPSWNRFFLISGSKKRFKALLNETSVEIILF